MANTKHHNNRRQRSSESTSAKMPWWRLSLFGIGCTLGTGFFLGTSIAIQKSGYAILLLLLLAAIGTYFVLQALAKLTAMEPAKGSFRTYAKLAFGRWAGFGSGWLYWSSEMLILGSSLMALGLFSQLWFPSIPLWMFATGYALLGMVVIFFGIKVLEATQSVLAIVKLAALVMFIMIGVGVVFGLFKGTSSAISYEQLTQRFFSSGVMGIWKAFIYAFYAFAGIEVMGLMAAELEHPEEASKAGGVMLATTISLYLAAIALVLLWVPLEQLPVSESPFISALRHGGMPIIVNIFNGVLIVAGFSSVAASLYAVTIVLVTLAEDGDAPRGLSAQKGKRDFPLSALGVTCAGTIVSIVLAYFIPKRIFEHITTAGGLVLMYTWASVVLSYLKLIPLNWWGKMQAIIALLLIGLAVVGTVWDKSSRPGLFVSLLFVAVIGGVTFMMHQRWKQDGAH
ncbi:amino acid permease [Paenibacillus assamensis]|uniref:amino acid permease n=1 Tax=Paenibacillus assamensis TaxID=311244 RepID=UPI0003FECD65